MREDSESGEAGSNFREAIIVGAGFAGLYALHRMRLLGLPAMVLEAGDDIGGTWHWNRYPGARCDVESLQYSYSFDEELYREWQWTERFATQPEILDYLNHAATKFDLRRDVRLNTRVARVRFDAGTNAWTVEATDGEVWTCRFLIMATGCLSSADLPKIEGIEDFAGTILHPPRWPKERIDFTGRRVGLIGTGSTGIQIAPVVAGQAEKLTIFQRSPSYSIPARNAPLTAEQQDYWKTNLRSLKDKARKATPSGIVYELAKKPATEADAEEKEQEFEKRWAIGGAGLGQAFNDILLNEQSNYDAAEFVRQKIRGIVKSPEIAEALSPSYPVFAKRICLDDGYFELFNRPNVELVALPASGIERITARGVVAEGVEHAVDTLIFATGFDAITGALERIGIENADGSTLKAKWSEGPRTYLGLMSAGFPNLFMVTGPGSPSILSNVIVAIEQHVEWIADCLAYMRSNGFDHVDVSAEAEDEWRQHVEQSAARTLFPRAASWYMGANIPGKPRVFLPYAGGMGNYQARLEDVVAQGYRGFRFARSTAPDAEKN